MHLLIKPVSIICMGLALSACSGTWEESNVGKPADDTTQATTAVAPAPVLPAQVAIIESPVSGTFVIIKDLKVKVNKTTAFHPNPTEEQVLARLREDAAKIGANALAEVRISDVKISALSWGTRVGTAKAIRLKN